MNIFSAAFYTPFFKEVWEKKPEIEQAFHMEEPTPVNSEDKQHSGRNHPYHIKLPSNEGFVPMITILLFTTLLCGIFFYPTHCRLAISAI